MSITRIEIVREIISRTDMNQKSRGTDLSQSPSTVKDKTIVETYRFNKYMNVFPDF